MELKLKLYGADRFQSMDFIAWKDDRISFYAKPRNGKPRVLTLVPSLPKGALWIKPPFPEHAPITIEPCLLLPPPIYESIEDQARNIDPEPWEQAWWDAHGIKFLHLNTADDEPLSTLLDEYKAIAKIDYESDKQELLDSALEAAEKKKRMECLETHYNAPLHRSCGAECAGVLNMTMGMVKRGCEGIRDNYLLQWWAQNNAIDIDAMAQQRSELMRYLQGRAGKAANISNYRDGFQKECEGVIPLKFHGDDDPLFKVLSALVKYRMVLENGKVAFLFDCTERKELRTDEWKELKQHHGVETPHARKNTAVRRKGGKIGKVKDPLTKKAIVAEYNKRLKNGKPKAAAEGTARWAEERFALKLSYRTIQNYKTNAENVEK